MMANHVCNEKCGIEQNKPHWYPDWEAADAAWLQLHPEGGEQAERMSWKDGYVQAYNDCMKDKESKMSIKEPDVFIPPSDPSAEEHVLLPQITINPRMKEDFKRGGLAALDIAIELQCIGCRNQLHGGVRDDRCAAWWLRQLRERWGKNET